MAGLPPAPAHTVIVVLENHGYGEVIGSPQAPYINGLAREGALFTESRAVTHPSEPNYLALFSGSTQGVTSDSCPHQFSAPNLASELIAADRTFPGMSRACPRRVQGLHERGVRPQARAMDRLPSVPAADNQPLSSFPAGDYRRLPDVSFVIPNLCDDMHDCPVATGDTWLRGTSAGTRPGRSPTTAC